ncbi:MAG: Sigma 54 modulation protein / ribosomal protein [Candidatus Parcubacteria bacterium]|jgi:ribosomal subunit interface protein
MNKTYKATGTVILSDEITSYCEEHLQKIERLISSHDSLARLDIELGAGATKSGPEFRAEMNLVTQDGAFRAEATNATLHAAIDECVDELRTELRKKITKHRDFIRRGAARVKEFFRNMGGR